MQTSVPCTPVGKAKISLRFPWINYGIEERLREIHEWVEAYPGTIDEVAMFTGLGMFPPDLRIIERQVADLKKAIPTFKALGLTAGIDQHTTIGSHYEEPGLTLNQPWQKMVGEDGAMCLCYCASDPRMQDYIRRLYIMLAETRPDFIWMDDDIRLTAITPSGYGCFCDLCLERFANETGQRWTRETLIATFSHGAVEERLSARKAWLTHNRHYLRDLYSLIRGAVDTVDPSIILGCMNSEQPYGGFGYEDIALALAGTRKLSVKWRPGAGFYTDVLPSHLLLKGHVVGRIAAFLPPIVTDIQSENEAFPSQSRQKSAAMLGLEIGVDIAAGCTGSALNFLSNTRDPIAEHRHKFSLVHTQRRFYDRLAGTFGRSPCEGIWSARTQDQFATHALAGGDWLAGSLRNDSEIIYEPAELGLPIAYGQEGAKVTILHDDTCLEFTREELLKILAGGVLLDVPALTRLNQMGFAEHTGFSVRTTISARTCEPFYELFTADPINGDFAGWQRDMWGGSSSDPIYLLEPVSAQSRTISQVAGFDVEDNRKFIMKTLGAGGGVFENRLGGRVAVMGCHPWGGPSFFCNMSLSLAKSSQIKALMRWLSKDELPAYVESFLGRIGLWCRRDSQGRPALFLVNVSLDAAERIHVMVRGAPSTLSLFRADGSAGQPLVRLKQDGAYDQFEIDHLKPMEMALLASELIFGFAGTEQNQQGRD